MLCPLLVTSLVTLRCCDLVRAAPTPAEAQEPRTTLEKPCVPIFRTVMVREMVILGDRITALGNITESDSTVCQISSKPACLSSSRDGGPFPESPQPVPLFI